MKKLFLISFFCLASTAMSLAQLKVVPTGRVGIGILAPSTLFHIKGISPFMTFENSSPSKIWQMGITGSDFSIVDGVSRLYIKNTSGNIGIGSTTPVGRLHVEGSGTKTIVDYGLYLTNLSTSSTATINKYGLYVNSTGTWNGTNAYNYGLFVNTQTSTNSYAAIFNGGNVGIGTAIPSTQLDIHNSSSIAQARVYSNSSSYEARYFVTNNVNGTSTGFAFGVDNSTNSGLGFISYGNLSSQTKIMKFNTSGNFSIGGSEPAGGTKLKIYSSLQSMLCEKTDATDNSYNIISKVTGSLVKAFAVQYNGGADKIYMYGSGDAYAEHWYDLSDLNFKENILDLQNPLDKVLQLRGVSFNFKPETLMDPADTLTVLSGQTPPTEIGLIAQEVEQIVPEAISTSNGNKYINYNAIVGLLVEAVKKQNQEIELLKARLDECCKATTPGTIDGK